MSPKSYFVSGLAAIAVMLVALPAAKGIDTSAQPLSTVEVNRTAKGDRIAEPRTIAVKKNQIQAPSAPVANREQTDKREIMDGCEPAFSPVTMPSMAHIAGRCIG